MTSGISGEDSQHPQWPGIRIAWRRQYRAEKAPHPGNTQSRGSGTYEALDLPFDDAECLAQGRQNRENGLGIDYPTGPLFLRRSDVRRCGSIPEVVGIT